MNVFDILLLDSILILFPVLIYLVYLQTNKNINKKTKDLMFNLSIFSSFFLIIKFGNNSYTLINFLILSILILISYLKDNFIIANLLLILLFFEYNLNTLLFIPFLFLIIIYIIKRIKKLPDFIFIDIFMFLECLILIFIKKLTITNIFIFISIYLIIHIIYMLIKKSEEIIKYHMNYKELQQEKQIRLSLFKVTHEIKNPIAVIKGYLDMLNVNNIEQVGKYIPIIKSEIERLLTLLEDFMLVNKNNVELDIMDINLLLEEVIDKIKPLLEGKNIKLDINLIDDEIYIMGDYKRLSQVFINLIKNSIEAIPETKEGLIIIKNSIKNNILNIVIIDNGIGIDKNIMNKIKEPFYTTKVKGTGLGVSLSNEIISAHKGSLNYISKEGNTKTIIDLPLCE